MLHLLLDFRFAWRSFRKAPLFSAVAVLSLALGIGANTAIFTLVDQLILSRLPVQDPDQLALLVAQGRHYGNDNGQNALSFPMFQDLRDGNQVFSGVMCRYRVTPSVGVGTETEVVGGELVSGNYFPLLGIRPAMGRLITPDDDVPLGAHPAAVLSYAWWQSRFAGNPDVVGQTIRVNGYPVRIVGVAYGQSTYPLQMRAFLEGLRLKDGPASILLNHVPNHLPLAELAGVSLQLSGHTHGGGQIFPFNFITRRAFGKFTYGLQRFGEMQVYTSSGAGTWGPPMRVGTHSEIVLLTFA